MIDFKQLEAFVRVAELGSFRAAAEKLHTTQPSISQRIAGLEDGLMVRVFDRGSRGIKLTEKGQELLSHAQRILDQRTEMLRVASNPGTVRGTLKLGTAETLIQTWMDSLLAALHQTYPALVVELHVDTSNVLRQQLIAHHMDLAFLVGDAPDPRLTHAHLCDYDVVWAASPRLGLHHRPLSLADLGSHAIITYPSNSLPYRDIRCMFNDAGVKSPRIYGSASISAIVQMAKRGMGPTVIAPAAMTTELKNGELVILDVDKVPSPLRFYACWHDTTDSHTLRAVARLAQRIAYRHSAHTV